MLREDIKSEKRAAPKSVTCSDVQKDVDVARPATPVRRDPLKAAKALEARFKETMKILS